MIGMIRTTACLLVASLGVTMGALAVNNTTPKGPAKKTSSPSKSAAKQTTKKAAATKQIPHKQGTAVRTATKQGSTKQGSTKQGVAKQGSTKQGSTRQGAAKQAATARPQTARTATSGSTKSGARTTAATTRRTTTTGTQASRRRRAAVPSWRASQQQPSTERVREIQSALINRGYMQGEADGNWGASTSDALKKFQQDQNITADGRLSSLSLIALGLGPKRTTAAAIKPAVPQRVVPGEPQSGNPPAAADPASPGGDFARKELQ